MKLKEKAIGNNYWSGVKIFYNYSNFLDCLAENNKVESSTA